MTRVSPSSHDASRRMARVRQKGTRAEIDLRKALHAKGLRYRLHVPLLTKPRRVADIVFPSARLAVFVDGCFWHGCPEHASWSWRDRNRPYLARQRFVGPVCKRMVRVPVARQGRSAKVAAPHL